MRRLVLAIGYQHSEQESVRREWLKLGIELDFADDLYQAKKKLPERDYYCVSLRSECIPHSEIDALRKVRAIPILVIPPGYNMAQRYECVQMGAAQYIHLSGQAVKDGRDHLRRCLEIPSGAWKPLTIITAKDLCFCLEYHTVEVRGQPIELTAKEFALLALLISNPKMVFTYEMLFQQVWRDEYTLTSKKTLNNHMSSLRRKLKIAPDIPDFIINIHSVGYKYDLS